MILLIVLVKASVSKSGQDANEAGSIDALDDASSSSGKGANSKISPLPKPKPANFCEGGDAGSLRRVSREAFAYWASRSQKPQTNSLVFM
jgi:hypothetical protein